MHPLIASLLLACIFCGCHTNRSKPAPISKQSPKTANALSTSNLSGIGIQTGQHNNTYWERFFQARGGSAVWQELKQNKAGEIVNIELALLYGSPTPTQVDEVAAGIIQYLAENKMQVKKLLITGDRDKNSGKRLRKLPPTIGKLTTLT